MNRSFKYGDGFFETIRVKDNQPTLWSFHVDRILSSCKVLGIDLPSSEKLDHVIDELLELCQGMELAKGRITFYRDGGGSYLPESNALCYHVEAAPLMNVPDAIFPTHTGNLKDLLKDVGALGPQKVGLYPNASVLFSPFSMLKSTSAALYVQGAIYASQMGWDDAFILNDKGHVVETTNSNIFAVYNRHIYTPSIESGCVAGVCRAYLLDRYDLLEADLSWDDLRSADMVFRSNALHGVRRIEIV